MVPALSLLLLGLLVPLARSQLEFSCQPDTSLPGCKAKCSGSPAMSIDISQTLKYPVPGINGENADSIYAYDCAGGLLCTDNIQNTTAVCENGKVYRGLATFEVVTWTLLQTKPQLMFSVEYGGAEIPSGGIAQPSLFVFAEVPGSGTPTVVFNVTDPKLTFHVTGDCVTSQCSGGGGDISGPIGLAVISLSILALITYFIVGSLVMYFARGARGIEVIPNVMFWKDFPFLIKDGMLFIISPCYKKGGDYEKI